MNFEDFFQLIQDEKLRVTITDDSELLIEAEDEELLKSADVSQSIVEFSEKVALLASQMGMFFPDQITTAITNFAEGGVQFES